MLSVVLPLKTFVQQETIDISEFDSMKCLTCEAQSTRSCPSLSRQSPVENSAQCPLKCSWCMDMQMQTHTDPNTTQLVPTSWDTSRPRLGGVHGMLLLLTNHV